jgi:hypothetical protein
MRRNLVFAEHNAEEVITIFFSIPIYFFFFFFFGESDNMLEHELEAAFLRSSMNHRTMPATFLWTYTN